MAGETNTVHALDITNTEEVDISESRYSERGFKPSFDELPWKEDRERRRLTNNRVTSR